MLEAPPTNNETARLAALNSYGVLDTEPEAEFDELTELAAELCATPIALVSLVDRSRQWFKARVGLDAGETPRRLAFCAHAILVSENVLVIQDAAADPRFADNPLVTGEPKIRFYAGAPIIDEDGHALGTLCVIDRKPRTLTLAQLSTLQTLAKQVAAHLSSRRRALTAEALVQQMNAVRTDLLHQLGGIAARAGEAAAPATHARQVAALSKYVDSALRPAEIGSVSLDQCVTQAAQEAARRCDTEMALNSHQLPDVYADPVFLARLFEEVFTHCHSRAPQAVPWNVTWSQRDHYVLIEVADINSGAPEVPSGDESRTFLAEVPASLRNIADRLGSSVWISDVKGAPPRIRLSIPSYKNASMTQTLPACDLSAR